MDQQQLRELLKTGIDANATAPAAVAGDPRYASGPVRDAIQAMRALLNSEPELQGGAKLLVGYSSFDAAWILPQVMLNRARTNGPDDAIRWLSKVLSATKVSVLRVMPLWGLEVSQPMDLTESIRLLPLSELPNLPQWSEPTGPRLVKSRAGGLVVGGNPFLKGKRSKLINLAAREAFRPSTRPANPALRAV